MKIMDLKGKHYITARDWSDAELEHEPGRGRALQRGAQDAAHRTLLLAAALLLRLPRRLERRQRALQHRQHGGLGVSRRQVLPGAAVGGAHGDVAASTNETLNTPNMTVSTGQVERCAAVRLLAVDVGARVQEEVLGGALRGRELAPVTRPGR